MAYLTEATVRQAARLDVLAKAVEAAKVLKEEAAPKKASFDIFLCHSIKDAEIVLGTKRILERKGLSVYVDWIVDPKMDRSAVSSETAEILRERLKQSVSLFYLYSENSSRSRWMPWEVGFFDAHNGNVAILPIKPTIGSLNFKEEEYLGLYPKVDVDAKGKLFVNRTLDEAVPVDRTADYKDYSSWLRSSDKLRPGLSTG